MADRIICMSKGRIEQIGTADSLYHRPDSLFVAGFIGSPPINLLAGESAGTAIRIGELTVSFDRPTAGRVTLGVRPEAIRLGEVGHAARVDDLEPHGRETIYHLETPLGALRALEAGSVARFRVGDRVKVDIDRALVFDDGGRRIGDAALPAG
jgi:inositol-phosphate transport system ATP-binding protein